MVWIAARNAFFSHNRNLNFNCVFLALNLTRLKSHFGLLGKDFGGCWRPIHRTRSVSNLVPRKKRTGLRHRRTNIFSIFSFYFWFFSAAEFIMNFVMCRFGFKCAKGGFSFLADRRYGISLAPRSSLGVSLPSRPDRLGSTHCRLSSPFAAHHRRFGFCSVFSCPEVLNPTLSQTSIGQKCQQNWIFLIGDNWKVPARNKSRVGCHYFWCRSYFGISLRVFFALSFFYLLFLFLVSFSHTICKTQKNWQYMYFYLFSNLLQKQVLRNPCSTLVT